MSLDLWWIPFLSTVPIFVCNLGLISMESVRSDGCSIHLQTENCIWSPGDLSDQTARHPVSSVHATDAAKRLREKEAWHVSDVEFLMMVDNSSNVVSVSAKLTDRIHDMVTSPAISHVWGNLLIRPGIPILVATKEHSILKIYCWP